jgi:aminoglycoside phosphotransferase (APT) family kinase protein
MSGNEVLDQLIAAARLPEIASTEPVDVHGDGLDNLLTKATLADGREVLLRESRVQKVAPTLRAKFLEACGVGAPRLYAANDRGAMLVDFMPGRQLSEMLATGTVNDRTWELTGAAFARVHAVRFPAPLQGLVGPASVVLEPVDPVDQLMAALEGSLPWLAEHESQVLPVIDHLRSFIRRRAGNIRAEVPCLVHGDANLLNIIVAEQVTLIDWDFPAVRYPLAELSALDEHVYLTAGSGLPPAFFAGYGRAVPADLLLAYRMVGCLRWLSSTEWKRWEVDRAMPASAQRRLRRWHKRLLEWVRGMPALAQGLQL